MEKKNRRQKELQKVEEQMEVKTGKEEIEN